jgi:predicted metal-dependent hydrolase
MTSELEAEVVYSSRATKPRIDMNIHGLKVVIPEGMNLEPETLIEEKRDWIRKKQAKFEELRSRIPDRKFEDGEEWPYKGKNHLLKVNGSEKSKVDNQHIILAERMVEKNGLKNTLEEFYRDEAREFIQTKVDEYTDKLNVEYDTLRVKNQKTLWGSCSSKNNLNFNWRLIMAPPDKAEYVIVHELCHLREPNHSNQFWELLSEYCENPKQKANWLKEHSVELIFTEDDL